METKRISGLGQIRIYTGKCFRMFVNEKGWKNFISAVIITLIIALVTGEDTFVVFKDTRNGAFALICACIWIGLFNSIQSICRERDIIKREHRTGLRVSSYVVAHMIYELALCAAEALIVTLIIFVKNWGHTPEAPLIFPAGIELYITFLLIIYSADVLGIAISSMVKTPNAAMVIMPFVLIIQLVMSGMIFELKGFAEKISYITISKWGLNAVCSTANVTELSEAIMVTEAMEKDYEHTAGHLVNMWQILLLFIVIYGIISVIALKFVDRDKR